MNKVVRSLLPLADVVLAPAVLPAAALMWAVRRAGLHRLPLSKKALLAVGVFPIRNHYYEPLFDTRSLRRPLDEKRRLDGIDWNVSEQLDLLKTFVFSGELAGIPNVRRDERSFHFNNGSFESGDAEYWYQLIRAKKPARIFEIGSGNSTLMARRAIDRNREENPDYRCKHVCVEPYEQPWLEKLGVTVMRQRVEELKTEVFSELERGDILFIDSSHVIRPQGDVLFEYLELLPSLNPGVIVHVHDVFSPHDYLKQWVIDEVKFWGEQYLLEAFLTSNAQWKILGALNYLHHHEYDALKRVCPYLVPEREPGSFYMEKIGR
jgi:predicted O-methyltransferase YrrM